MGQGVRAIEWRRLMGIYTGRCVHLQMEQLYVLEACRAVSGCLQGTTVESTPGACTVCWILKTWRAPSGGGTHGPVIISTGLSQEMHFTLSNNFLEDKEVNGQG